MGRAAGEVTPLALVAAEPQLLQRFLCPTRCPYPGDVTAHQRLVTWRPLSSYVHVTAVNSCNVLSTTSIQNDRLMQRKITALSFILILVCEVLEMLTFKRTFHYLPVVRLLSLCKWFQPCCVRWVHSDRCRLRTWRCCRHLGSWENKRSVVLFSIRRSNSSRL